MWSKEGIMMGTTDQFYVIYDARKSPIYESRLASAQLHEQEARRDEAEKRLVVM